MGCFEGCLNTFKTKSIHIKNKQNSIQINSTAVWHILFSLLNCICAAFVQLTSTVIVHHYQHLLPLRNENCASSTKLSHWRFCI